eukprot:jgi/Chrzof1/15144/Cz09g28230.t1
MDTLPKLKSASQSRTGPLNPPVISIVAEAEDIPVCWICLDGHSIERPLMHPCRCPSYCHASCIARWQLQSAGSRRELFCDFCNSRLPEWKNVLTPSCGATAPAVMNVNFDNKTYSFQVAPGPDGYKQFTEAIRKAFRLPDDSELNITFTCDEPSSGALLTLSGPGAYDAAVHCASVSAARRTTSEASSDCCDSEAADRAQVIEAMSATSHTDRAVAISQYSSSTSSPSSSSSTPRASRDTQPARNQVPASAAAVPSHQGNATTRPRAMSGFGRKLRNAFSDLLVIK